MTTTNEKNAPRDETSKAAIVLRSAEKPEHPLAKHTLTGKLLGSPVNILCPGCGYGAVAMAVTKVLSEEENIKKFPLIQGIGCYTSLATLLPIKQSISALHGRPLAIATGVKLANPDFKPIVFTGDGDCLAIGGTHFINACRRNLDAVVIMLNNSVYGMTGGQSAPTLKTGEIATTAPYGYAEEPFNAVDLAISAGATFVARWSSVHIREFMRTLKKAINHKGLSFIEIIATCPTNYGRKNGLPEIVDTFTHIRDNSIKLKDPKKRTEEEKSGKIILGEFHQSERRELSDNYQKVMEIAQGGAK